MSTDTDHWRFAKGWRTDLDKARLFDSHLLACTFAANPTAWFRGEAQRHENGWLWVGGGQLVEPEFVPRAWMPMPFALADQEPAPNVVDLPVITKLDLDPARVLAKAAAVEFERVAIIGKTKDGDEFFASSASDGGTALWDMERAKLRLLRAAD